MLLRNLVEPELLDKNRLAPIQSTMDQMWTKISTKIGYSLVQLLNSSITLLSTLAAAHDLFTIQLTKLRFSIYQ